MNKSIEENKFLKGAQVENEALERARHFHKINLFSPELQQLFDELKDEYEKAVKEAKVERTEEIKKIITDKFCIGCKGNCSELKCSIGKVLKAIEG